jgi:hypothetical protein
MGYPHNTQTKIEMESPFDTQEDEELPPEISMGTGTENHVSEALKYFNKPCTYTGHFLSNKVV